MARRAWWLLAALAVAAVLAVQLFLLPRWEDAPECVCPAVREIKCTEVIEIPCGREADVSERAKMAEIGRHGLGSQEPIQLAPGARTVPRLSTTPTQHQQRTEQMYADEGTSGGNLCSLLEDDGTALLRARRLADTEWQKRCSEAETIRELQECQVRAVHMTEDWMSQLEMLKERPSLGEIATMAEAMTALAPQLDVNQIRVNGADLIYGEPGVEGKFSIETEGYPFGGTVFRVTLVGPEIVNIAMEDHQNGFYTGSYVVRTAGLYQVTIVFESGHYESSLLPPPGKNCQGAVIYQGDLEVTGFSVPSPEEPCKSLDMMTNGRHVLASQRGTEGEFAWHWKPWQCGLQREWSVEIFKKCVEDRALGRILLLGDSGTVPLSRALGADAADHPAYCLFAKALCDYLPLHFGVNSASEVTSLLPRHIPQWAVTLAGNGPINTVPMPGRRNILVWNVGYRELIEDLSLSEFARNAEEVSQAIAKYWEGEQFFRTSYAVHRRCAGEAERYWALTNERLAEYSSLVEDIVRSAGGHVLDNYNITAAMRSSTSDLKSYQREIQHESAVLLLNAICVADDWL